MKNLDFNSLLEMDMKKQEERKKKKEHNAKKNDLTNTNINISKIFNNDLFMNLRKKVRKNFFIGFGFGLMIASIAFFIFSDNNIIENENDLTDKYTDAKVIEKAKSLGMIFPEEINVGETNND